MVGPNADGEPWLLGRAVGFDALDLLFPTAFPEDGLVTHGVPWGHD